MRNELPKILLAAAVLLGSASLASAHHGANAGHNFSGHNFSSLAPSAGSRKELTIRQVAPIEFGMLTGGAGGGSVTINAKTGARIVGGGLQVLAGNYGRAEFEITGQPAGEVMLYFQPRVNLANNGGGITLTKFTADPPGIIHLDQHGYARVGVGATLQAVSRSAHGKYNGAFMVDARYVH